MSTQPGPWGQQPGQNQPGQNQPGQNQPGQNQPGQNQPGGWSPQGASPSGWGPQGGQPPGPAQGGQPYGQGGQPYGQGKQPTYGGPPSQGPPPGYGPYPGGGGYQPPPGSGSKKSPALIIGIVVVAVVLIAAVGGIVMALGRGNDEPVSTVTPGQQSAPPTTDPSSDPSSDPSDPSTEPSDSSSTSPTSDPSASEPPTGGGKTYSLDNDISLTAADGWTAETTESSYVVLQSSKGEVFEGQSAQLKGSADPKQVVDTWHQQLAKKMSDVQNGETKSVDVGVSKLNAASGTMGGTIATSQGSLYVITESIVSVRKSDGVTVIATLRYFKDSDPDELKAAFKVMGNSMLVSQAKG